MEYADFIASKPRDFRPTGFEVSPVDINDTLFGYQEEIVRIACKKGRYGVFAECGLGKTFIQLEFARLVENHTRKPFLIVAPLEVCWQTIRESKKLDIDFNIKFAESSADIGERGLYITNYQKLEKFRDVKFGGVALDESSILKSFTGSTKRLIFELFAGVEYKLACSATPSPNDLMEILNQAEFLDVIKSTEALAEWFINDTMNFGTYRLKEHAKKDFYRWLCSWSCSLTLPSDLGFSDDGFVLPPLEIKEVAIGSDFEFGEEASEKLNATNFNTAKRESLADRVKWCADKVAEESEKQFVIWCELNDEADALKLAIPDAVEIRGNTSDSIRKQAVEDFLAGKIRVLISKPSIFGFGLNFQNCSDTIFCGLKFSYEGFYQAVKRFHRFGQTKPVCAWVVIGQKEKQILEEINRKRKAHLELQESMRDTVREFQSLEFGLKKEFKVDYNARRVNGERWQLINGDCVEEIKSIASESVDFQIFSPPFSSLYIYSDSYRDMGNCRNDEEFFNHFKFLIPQLKRILRTGRLCAVHCKQLVNYAGTSGMAGLRDFRGEIIRAFVDAGFSYHSEVFIWKDPVIEMQRTKAQGLLYKQLRKDSSYSRVGLPEYLLLFRKWGDKENQVPVEKTKENFPLNRWQAYASPSWDTDGETSPAYYNWQDIRQTNVLNVKQARADKDEKHICPLQLDVIERAVELWTNPNDVVFTPFAGIGSELYQSLKLGRRAIGIELKAEYFEQAIRNCECAVSEAMQSDFLGVNN